MVGAGGNGQQLRRHITVGIACVVPLQQETGRGVGMDYRAALHRPARHEFFYVFPKCR